MSRARVSWLLVLALAACGEAPTEPQPPTAQPGWLDVEFTSPYTDDGGLVVTLSGGPIDSVRTAPGCQVIARPAAGGTWQALVLGAPLPRGAVGAIHVPDVAQASRYTAVIRQAAARGTWAQRDPAGYTLTVRAP